MKTRVTEKPMHGWSKKKKHESLLGKMENAFVKLVLNSYYQHEVAYGEYFVLQWKTWI